MGNLFGTDGVRGIPGEHPLTAELVRRLAYTAARVFLETPGAARHGAAPTVLLGRDTRGSGPLLARWLTQGFARAGCVTVDLGVVTTPAVSYLAPRRKALFGAVISASHNPPEFNGIKFFTGEGFKAPPSVENEIEKRLAAAPEFPPAPRGSWVRKEPGAVQAYLDYLRSSIPPMCDLGGLRLVVDGANGAASGVAAGVLRGLGAEVFAIGCSPNGRNINTGFGALDTEAMRREVVRRKAHAGISLDGDADRAILCDERGKLLDGDALICMAALHLQEQGLLRGGKVVLTVMSNFGMIRFLESKGIGVLQVPVGDRNVTDAIEQGGYCLGGETSGHIVFRRLAPTGDGLLTALQTMAVLAQSGRRMSYFGSLYRSYPQILKNVRVDRRVPLDDLPQMTRCIEDCTRRLKGAGRIFVRYSGTEPLLRILVEGPSASLVRGLSNRLAETFKKEVASKG